MQKQRTSFSPCQSTLDKGRLNCHQVSNKRRVKMDTLSRPIYTRQIYPNISGILKVNREKYPFIWQSALDKGKLGNHIGGIKLDKIENTLFSLAKYTWPNLPLPSGFPMSKSLKVHLFSASLAFEGDCKKYYSHIRYIYSKHITFN